MFRAALPLFLLTLAPGSTAAAELGQPLVEVFGPRDYGASTHNWSAVQDRSGRLHVANRDLVLSYDGHNWRSTATGGSYRTLLAIDDNDRIWLGGPDALGYLEADGHGVRRFTSIWDQLPAADRDYRGTSGVHVLPNAVWFSAWDRLLRRQNGEFTRTHELHLPYQPGSQRPYGQAADRSWRIFDGDAWQPLANAPELRDTTIMAIMPQADGSTILATRHQGLWRARDGYAERVPTEVDATLRERQIAIALQLRDGTMAIALYPTDFLLLSASGELLSFIDRDPDGQRTPLVEAFFQDRDDDLWVLRRTGIARITWPSALSVFNQGNGIPSSSIRIARRHGNRLYLGKSDGLSVLEPPAPGEIPARPARFVPVPGYTDSVWDFLSVGDDLVVGGLGGVRILNAAAETTRLLPDDIVIALLRPRGMPDVVLAGAERGLFLLRRGPGGWKVEAQIPGVDAATSRLVEEPDGTVWISTLNQGYYRLLDFRDPLHPQLEHYPGGHGFPEAALRGEVIMSRAGDRPVFLYRNVVYRFDDRGRRFEPWITAEQQFQTKDVDIVDLYPGVDGALWFRTLRRGNEAGPWGGRQLWRRDANGTSRPVPFAVFSAVGEVMSLSEERHPETGEAMAWIGGTGGLVRAGLPGALLEPRTFRAIVREVAKSGQQTLPLAGTPPKLSPADHMLRISVGTDRLDDRDMQFQFRLEGRDDDWGTFAAGSVATFEYLPAGRYTLHARARDADGRLSEQASFAFIVLPPWWATWWAGVGYALAAGLAIAGFIRWRLHQLRRRNLQLESLVASRTAELEGAKLGAEAASHAKSAFLASMSHELRTPLNAILGYAQILRREPGLSEKGRHQLGIVGRNGEHLLQMINEVLDLAKIEAGKLDLHAAAFPLSRAVKAAADLLEQRAADKGLAFRLELGAGLPRVVSTDEQKLRQVLLNLLGNAIKFTEQGEVVLAASRLNGHVRFEVRDTGPGIAADQLVAIFQPFHQAAPSTAAQGTGLGLAISQRIVALLGGTIQVESKLGGGSRFWFDLPLAEAAVTATGAASVRTISGYAGPRRRLLVVDDEPTNRAVLRDLLESLGFVIEEAANGAEALARMEKQAPDGILLDLRMPVLGGLETLPRLRALAPGKSVPVIAVSASVLGFNQDDAIAAGCNAFLPKPVQEARLLETLGRLLELDWNYHDGATPFEPAGPASDFLPDPTILEELASLARGGDVDALREHIASLLAREAAGGPFLRQLDQLAATFRTGEIRSRLDRARSLP